MSLLRTLFAIVKICDIIDKLNQSRINFVIMGDTNINLDKKNLAKNVFDYYNNLQGAGCLSLINRSTRVVRRGDKIQSSCLDHIFTNLSSEKTDAYIITSNISDHFSTMLKLQNVRNAHIPKHDVFVRKKNLSREEINNLNDDLKMMLNEIDYSNSNPVYLTNNLVHIYQSLSDKYMPLEKLSRKEKGFYYKPWITRGIRESMNTRDNLNKRKNIEKTQEAESYYKRYKNFVNRLQNESFNAHYSK